MGSPVNWSLAVAMAFTLGGWAVLRGNASHSTEPSVADLDSKLQNEVLQQLDRVSGLERSPKRLETLTDSKIISHDPISTRELFDKYCQGCHGSAGKGDGEGAKFLRVPPRNFHSSVFKHTSTAYGEPPLDEDVVNVINRGIPGAGMPRFHFLGDEQRRALASLVIAVAQRGKLERDLTFEAFYEEELTKDSAEEIAKEIAARWENARLTIPRTITPRPQNRQKSIEQGRLAYFRLECNTCHASDARGRVRNSVGKDVWGNDVRAPDLTTGRWRHGEGPQDVYRAIAIGITGTPMPGYYEALRSEPDTLWNLVDFLEHLSK